MSREEPVAVVGAGLIGCAAALFLARRGLSVEVFEGRADPRREPPQPGRSVALVLSARGWRALSALGLEGAVRRLSIPLPGRVVHPASGDRTFHAYGAEGQAIYVINRVDLNAVLLDALDGERGVRVHFEARCTGVDLATDTIAFDGAARPLPARVLAADGAFSRVRRSLIKSDRFDYEQKYVDYGYKELTIPAPAGGGFALEPPATHVWPRGRFMLTAFPLLGGSSTCTFIMPFEGEVSFQSVATAGEARRLFEREFPDALAMMPHLDTEYASHPTCSLLTMRCYPWVHSGRIAFIGDAAHAMVPFFGQGMNAGFEDCQVLDDCLERHGNAWGPAIDEYQRLRKPNCDAVTDLSLRHFRELSDRVGDPLFALEKKLEQRIHRRHPDRFIPLYTRVAFTHMPYADALAASDRQRALLDEILRMPDIEARWEDPAVDAAIDRLVAAL
jgi:kynurenine 3-monooxygenase